MATISTSELSRNDAPFSPFAKSEYPRIFQVTGANQNPRKLLPTDLVKIDYFIESAPYGFLFTSRKTLETKEWA